MQIDNFRKCNNLPADLRLVQYLPAVKHGLKILEFSKFLKGSVNSAYFEYSSFYLKCNVFLKKRKP